MARTEHNDCEASSGLRALTNESVSPEKQTYSAPSCTSERADSKLVERMLSYQQQLPECVKTLGSTDTLVVDAGATTTTRALETAAARDAEKRRAKTTSAASGRSG